MTDFVHSVHVHTDRLEVARRNAALRASPTQDEIARKVQSRPHGRWLCWFGNSTGRYWAIRTVPGPFRLVEGRTPKELIIAMAEIDAFYGGRS